MPVKLTSLEFIQRAKKVHNNLYVYSNSIYNGMHKKLIIICRKHGKYSQSPANHLAGKGCPKCKNEKTSIRCKHSSLDFIKKAQKIHGNVYDYSQIVYKLDNQKITIMCKEHGEFTQTPRSHLSGNGCPKCAGFNLSFKEFVKQASKIHKGKYDYSLAEQNYRGMSQKISIICKIHGIFMQSPGIHLRDTGCAKCGHTKTTQKKTHTTDMFVKRAKLIHNDYYDYSKTVYIQNKKKVIIICPKHGEFEQSPDNHLAGKNCSHCVGKISKEEMEVVCFLKSLNVEIKTNQRGLISPKELDIVLPEYNIAIEYNGLYWHSSAMKHFNKLAHQAKSRACKNIGYRLIHIFSDDWKFKKEIVKSILRITLQKGKYRFYARKGICKSIDKQQAFKFLDLNHIQGSVISSHYIGLFFNDQLTQVMTFKKTGVNGQFSLNRFASLLNTQVVGGASKLFKFFCRQFIFTSIITFCDLSTFSGALYTKLGFKKVNEISIDYSYIVNGVRKHKFGFRRKRLETLLSNFDATKSELWNTRNNNIYRIYDCGKIKYEFKKNMLTY